MAKFNEGDEVVIVGLVSKAELNGCTARIGTFNVATGRHTVVVEDGTALSMKPSNIKLAARPGRFKAGDVVVIEGLQSKLEFNGCTARVRTNLETGRHHVEIYKCGTGLSIKPSNARRATPTEEQAAKRAALLKRLAALPEHLRLGVTLPGMRELLSQLPGDAVEQVNRHNAKYPPNKSVNGYINQFFLALWAKGKEGQPGDELAVCERLRKRGSPHVGEATVFVSWFLDTPIATLLDALANFLKQQGLREEDTFFWVCDYVIRQTNFKTDLARLGDASAPSGTRCC